MKKHTLLIQFKESNRGLLRPIGVALLCLVMSMSAYAQSRVVHGKVTDTNGESIIGASVKVSGTSKGTITDVDGKFKIEVTPKDKLTITFIGYTGVEVVASNTNLTITLRDDNKVLDEVVVVGYGTQKKATLTGAVSAVRNEEIAMTKNENVVNMLTGKLPGVRITQASSQPGSFDTKIDIRGMGEPLIVVDGIPRDKDYFSRMDANEIESVSVLKDASAAIYGLRSANGVLLVTTKRGQSSQSGFEISYSMNYGWQQFLHTPDNVDALEYMTLANEKNRRGFNENYMSRRPALYGDVDREPYLNGTLQTTDWMGELFKETTPQQQHNLTINGGTEKVSYFLNLGYMKQEGSLKSGSMNYDRWNFRANIDANITKRLKSQLTLGGYLDEKNEPRTDIWAVYKNAWVKKPTTEIYANGNPLYLNNREIGDDNPLASTNADITGYRRDINRVFNGQLALSYDVPGIAGLTAKAMYSYDFKYLDKTDYSKMYYLYDYDPLTEEYKQTAKNSPSSVRREAFPDYKTLMQFSLNYKHTFFDVHNISGLFLFEEEYSNWDSFYAYRQIKVNSEYLFAGETDKQEGNMYDIGERVSKAWVGKFNYDYKSKYIGEVSFRYDGSSRYPSESRWGFFPAVSVGWRISEEAFVKENVSLIDNLKVRASYGKMGDDREAGNYPPNIVGYELDANERGWIYNGGLVGGVKPTAIPNPNLTWYTSKTLDIGLDLELWNGLLGGSFDYFQRNRDGLLKERGALIPGTVGAALPKENLESDRTFGFEVSLSHRNKIGEVSYFVTGQLSSTQNRWKTKIEEKAGNSYDNWRNREANRNKDIWWGKSYGGQFTSYNQIYSHPISVGAGASVPGDYWYEDRNGDGVIDGKDDYPIASYGLPLINYGLTLGANWRGFDMNMHFQGSARVYVMYNEMLAEPLAFNGGGTMAKFWDRWHPTDPEADIFDPSTQWVSGYYPITGSPLAEGTRAIEDASYLRLKTIEIGYTLPKKWLRRVEIKDIRVYFSGYNLLTFTGLKNSDPEHPGSAGGSSTKDGVDSYKYPINKTFNIGAAIKF